MVNLCQPGSEPIPGYQLTRFLGRGGFGEVWLAEAPGGLSKAVKLAPIDQAGSALNCRELDGLKKMRSIRHPYLLSIERFEIVESFLVIVMELADKNLAERFAECRRDGMLGVPREELLGYMKEAAEVLDLMGNQHGLQHLDIKPENLFLSSGHVKVADFGLVQPRNTNMSRSALAISPPYAPPELFDGRVEPTADQYSLAVTYQELLTGIRPYDASDVRGLVMQHLTGRPDLASLPAGDRPIIARALQRDAASRFTCCAELIDALLRAHSISTKPSMAIRQINARGPSGTDIITPPAPRQKAETQPIQPMVTKTGPARFNTMRAEIPTKPIAGDTKAMGKTKNLSDCPVDRPRATFIAFLPLEIFAFKLRGFIDALGAEIISCTDDKTVLRFGVKGWLNRRTSHGLFLEMQTYCRNPHSGYRVVDVQIWTPKKDVELSDLGRRAMLLIRCLKAYLMASDSKAPVMMSEAQLREEILT